MNILAVLSKAPRTASEHQNMPVQQSPQKRLWFQGLHPTGEFRNKGIENWFEKCVEIISFMCFSLFHCLASSSVEKPQGQVHFEFRKLYLIALFSILLSMSKTELPWVTMRSDSNKAEEGLQCGKPRWLRSENFDAFIYWFCPFYCEITVPLGLFWVIGEQKFWAKQWQFFLWMELSQ